MNMEEHKLYDLIKENYSGPISFYKYNLLTEQEKVNISKSLIDQIYVSVAERYNSIDFETIPKSHGKIRAMSEYANLVKSLEMLNNIAEKSKQDIPEIKILVEALANLERYEDKFYTGYVKNISPVMMIYQLLTMAVYCGTSLMISVFVDYINLMGSDNSQTVDIVINKKYTKHQSYLMIDSLKKFNDEVKSGAFQKYLDTYIRQGTQKLNESAIAVTFIVILSIIAILKAVPITKELIYLFFYTRMKLSDSLQIQADLVNGNMEALKNSGVNSESRIYKIQKWFADKLTALADKFAFTYEKGEKQAENEARKKLTSDDVVLF